MPLTTFASMIGRNTGLPERSFLTSTSKGHREDDVYLNVRRTWDHRSCSLGLFVVVYFVIEDYVMKGDTQPKTLSPTP